jgi:hypothetical protein
MEIALVVKVYALPIFYFLLRCHAEFRSKTTEVVSEVKQRVSKTLCFPSLILM